MSSLIINAGPISSIVEVPRSKSHANRALIIAALKTSDVILAEVPQSDDVKNLINCLKQVGLAIEGESRLLIRGSFPTCESRSHLTLSVGEGGTTARFLAALLLLGKTQYTLELGGKLAQRPWEEFMVLAKKLGAKASLEGNKLTIQGPIEVKHDITIDCSKTTQFASAFMMIADIFGHKVVPLGLGPSKSYFEVTQNLISHFRTNASYEVPRDWSSASYGMVFGALKHKIFFPHLHLDPSQADEKLVYVLKELDAIHISDLGIEVFPFKKNKEIQLDASDCLDLVPSLAFLLSHVPGQHKLENIQNLVYKESNRVEEVLLILRNFGKTSRFDGKNLLIEGVASFITPFMQLTVAPDHRMVMTAALFMRSHGGGELSPTEAVNKSYPQFFQLMSF